MNWSNYKEGLAALFEQGGLTLWAILFASILLWILIVERYWVHWRQLPGMHEQLLTQWRNERASVADSLVIRRVPILRKHRPG